MTTEIQYRYPLDGGYVNNPFKAGVHEGFDMIEEVGGTLGAPIYSVSTGTVIGKGTGSPGQMFYDYGHWLEIRMVDGVYVFTAHMDAVSDLAVGQHVNIGQQIGIAGESGNAKGPHVHTGFMTKSLDKATSFNGVPYINARLHAEPAGGGGTPVTPKKKGTKDMFFYYIAAGAIGNPSKTLNLFILNGPGYHAEFVGQSVANGIAVQSGGCVSVTRAFANWLKTQAFPGGVPASAHEITDFTEKGEK